MLCGIALKRGPRRSCAGRFCEWRTQFIRCEECLRSSEELGSVDNDNDNFPGENFLQSNQPLATDIPIMDPQTTQRLQPFFELRVPGASAKTMAQEQADLPPLRVRLRTPMPSAETIDEWADYATGKGCKEQDARDRYIAYVAAQHQRAPRLDPPPSTSVGRCAAGPRSVSAPPLSSSSDPNLQSSSSKPEASTG